MAWFRKDKKDRLILRLRGEPDPELTEPQERLSLAIKRSRVVPEPYRRSFTEIPFAYFAEDLLGRTPQPSEILYGNGPLKGSKQGIHMIRPPDLARMLDYLGIGPEPQENLEVLITGNTAHTGAEAMAASHYAAQVDVLTQDATYAKRLLQELDGTLQQRIRFIDHLSDKQYDAALGLENQTTPKALREHIEKVLKDRDMLYTLHDHENYIRQGPVSIRTKNA
jgi:hypothetical protein